MSVRDITLEDTIDIKFTTRSFSTGAPTTLAGTPVISAYPGNSVTQLTAGITLTVDFDSVTGLHNVRVVATSANGYAASTDYALVITTGTVGGVSVVGEVVGEFTTSRTAAAVDLANGTDGLGAIKAETASILTDTAEIGAAGAGLTEAGGTGDHLTAINLPNQTMDITGNITGNLSGSVGSVTGAVGSVTGAVGSVTGLTASDVGAIKTQTDKFVFTVANQVDSNVQSINNVTLVGDGVGTPMGA